MPPRTDRAWPAGVTWLLTGGAGHIGLDVFHTLQAADEDVVVLDDLSTGRAPFSRHRSSRGSVGDAALLDRTFEAHAVRGVVHLAAKKQLDESVADPLLHHPEDVTPT